MSKKIKLIVISLAVLGLSGCALMENKPETKGTAQYQFEQQQLAYQRQCVQSNLLETDLTQPPSQRIYKASDRICSVGAYAE